MAVAGKVITNGFVEEICRRIESSKRTRRSLPVWGRVQVDRPLPVVCVYRKPVDKDDSGTADLVTTEAIYIQAPAKHSFKAGLKRLVFGMAKTLREQFGEVLIVELWAGSPEPLPEGLGLGAVPRFRLFVPRHETLGRYLDVFEESLSRVVLQGQQAKVEMVRSSYCYPPGAGKLLPYEPGWHVLGLEVAPVYRSPEATELFPVILRHFRRQLSRALQRSFYRFTQSYTTHRPRHFRALGPRVVRKVVFDIDRRLGEVSSSFDFLLQVTPVNSEQAWRSFRASRYRRAPVLHYRPLLVDPVKLKRDLFKIPIERVEDPALAHILREKQDELDRQITMLGDISTPRFLLGGAQLYGEVEEPLRQLAEELLRRLPRRMPVQTKDSLNATAFAERAREEFAEYQRQCADIEPALEIRADIGGGIMVSRGVLFIGRETNIPAGRVEAVVQHEIGTHVLTYYNGRAQPLNQLRLGLAGYESLQEGLAVLSEYLVGGLNRPRLRLLAARVLGVDRLIRGSSFVDTFAEIHESFGFPKNVAFSIALRIYRGDGFAKDVVYLRGLCEVLNYLAQGGELEQLFVGKIALKHLPIISELRHRGILINPPLRPRYLDIPMVSERLAAIRNGVTVLDLIMENR